jgi:hypothetical protein
MGPMSSRGFANRSVPAGPRLPLKEGIEDARVVETLTAHDLHWYPRPTRPLLKGTHRLSTAAVKVPTEPRRFFFGQQRRHAALVTSEASGMPVSPAIRIAKPKPGCRLRFASSVT